MKRFKRLYYKLLEDNSNDETPDENPTWPDSGDVDKDFEKHSTNFPHGLGHPNINKNYRKVVFIDSIEGVPEEETEKFQKEHAKTTEEYAKKYLNFLNLDFLDNKPEGHYERHDIIADRIRNKIDFFKHWATAAMPNTQERWHKEEYEKAHHILKEHPDAFNQIEKFYQYVYLVNLDAPDNVENESNYPLFVSLYDRTRQLGGNEEGGWWYDNDQLIKSIKVQSFDQAEKVARQLYNSMQGADLDGQPYICLEKREGSREMHDKPYYE